MRNRRITMESGDLDIALIAMRYFKKNLPRQFWNQQNRLELATKRIDALKRSMVLMEREGSDVIELTQERVVTGEAETPIRHERWVPSEAATKEREARRWPS